MSARGKEKSPEQECRSAPAACSGLFFCKWFGLILVEMILKRVPIHSMLGSTIRAVQKRHATLYPMKRCMLFRAVYSGIFVRNMYENTLREVFYEQ